MGIIYSHITCNVVLYNYSRTNAARCQSGARWAAAKEEAKGTLGAPFDPSAPSFFGFMGCLGGFLGF